MRVACVPLQDRVSGACAVCFMLWDTHDLKSWLLEKVLCVAPTASLSNPRERSHTDSSHFPFFILFFFQTALSSFHQDYNFCAKLFFTTFLHLLTVCPPLFVFGLIFKGSSPLNHSLSHRSDHHSLSSLIRIPLLPFLHHYRPFSLYACLFLS